MSEEIKTFEDFKYAITAYIDQRPPHIRKGQYVFDVVDYFFGVARDVQFEDKIDCFFDDNKIEDFLKAAWKRINKD